MKRETFLKVFISLCMIFAAVLLCRMPNGYAADAAPASGAAAAQGGQAAGNDAAASEEDAKAEKEKMDKATQVALVAAQDLMQTNKLAEARTPLLQLKATNPPKLPEVFYLMLGQCWYGDESTKEESARKKMLEEAQNVFKEGFAAYPESDNLLLNCAITTYELEQFGDAGALFEKIYDRQAVKDIKYLGYAGAAFYAAQKLEDARRIYLKMIASTDKPETAWYETVIAICLELNDSAGAEKYTFVALDLFPTEIKYWNLLARISLDKEDYKGAASALEVGTKVKMPEKSEDWATLIDLYNAINVPLRSVKGLVAQMALSKKPITEAQHIAVAELYSKAYRVDEAVKYLDSVIATTPSSALLLEKAKLLYGARKNEEAIKAFDDCIKADKKIAGEASFMKGLAAWDMEDWDAAESAFNGALDDKEFKTQAKDALDVIASLDDARNK